MERNTINETVKSQNDGKRGCFKTFIYYNFIVTFTLYIYIYMRESKNLFS